MAHALRVPRRQAIELSTVSKIDRQKLESLLRAFEKLSSPMIRPSEVRTFVGNQLGSNEDGLALAQQLMALSAYCRETVVTSDEAVKALMRGLDQSIGIDEIVSSDDKANLEKLSDILAKLIDERSISASSKALELATDYANFYHSGNIIIDMRPIFDDQREDIIGSVISQTLRLEYHSSDGVQSLSVAMTTSDLKALKQACDFALAKAVKARQLIESEARLTAFLSGEETYDPS